MGKLGTGVYTDAEALAAAIAGGLSKVVWIDASVPNVVNDANRTTTLTWTDLDLTSSTSADATIAELRLQVHIDSITAGAGNIGGVAVRKDDTTPGAYPDLWVDGASWWAGSWTKRIVFVGLDTDEVMEYQLEVAGTIQWDTRIDVLAYVE